jgi:uncharacterized protein (DUF1501 family)
LEKLPDYFAVQGYGKTMRTNNTKSPNSTEPTKHNIATDRNDVTDSTEPTKHNDATDSNDVTDSSRALHGDECSESELGCAQHRLPAVPVPGEATQKVVLLTRRHVVGGLLGGAGALAFGSLHPSAAAAALRTQTAASPSAPAVGAQRDVLASPAVASVPKAAPGNGILVMLTLYGGNDGLNTVVPNDSAYLAARGELAHQPNTTLKLDDAFGLNPAMPGFKSLWDAKRLAIVRGVGYPNPNRSHFRSMDIWQTAAPERVEVSGWLGRWHDASGGDPLRMVNIGASMPRAMVSLKGGGGAALPNGNLVLPGGAGVSRAFAELGRTPSTRGPLAAKVLGNNNDLLRVIDSFGPILKGNAIATGAVSLEGGATANGDYRTLLDDQFDEVARLVNGGAPTRVFGVSLGGFDTHASEKESQARLLGAVDRAVTRFVNTMAASSNGMKVTVLIYSEFGRRVKANDSGGTDHGTASSVFVVGPQVNGGFYGDAPSLTDLDDGDLKFTTDFRGIYSTMLSNVLGVDPAAVLGKAFPGLQVV